MLNITYVQVFKQGKKGHADPNRVSTTDVITRTAEAQQCSIFYNLPIVKNVVNYGLRTAHVRNNQIDVEKHER